MHTLGNENLVCQADVTPPSDGRAATWSFENKGVPCYTGIWPNLIPTENWNETVSADGKATLHCESKS